MDVPVVSTAASSRCSLIQPPQDIQQNQQRQPVIIPHENHQSRESVISTIQSHQIPSMPLSVISTGATFHQTSNPVTSQVLTVIPTQYYSISPAFAKTGSNSFNCTTLYPLSSTPIVSGSSFIPYNNTQTELSGYESSIQSHNVNLSSTNISSSSSTFQINPSPAIIHHPVVNKDIYFSTSETNETVVKPASSLNIVYEQASQLPNITQSVPMEAVSTGEEACSSGMSSNFSHTTVSSKRNSDVYVSVTNDNYSSAINTSLCVAPTVVQSSASVSHKCVTVSHEGTQHLSLPKDSLNSMIHRAEHISSTTNEHKPPFQQLSSKDFSLQVLNANENGQNYQVTNIKPKPKKTSNVHCVSKVQGDSKLSEPEIIRIDGKKSFKCRQCSSYFRRKYEYCRHQTSHTQEKRGSLTLKNKIDIINRVKAGEKCTDLAIEYHVGRSTLTFIVKNADKFLSAEKDGKLSINKKRMRGAVREDVEDALYFWYRQSLEMKIPMTGPKLCEKAREFARLLGHEKFKATHGWLDRFKHRRNITLNRNKIVKNSTNSSLEDIDHHKNFTTNILPPLLMEYDHNNIFYAEEFSMYYSILPEHCSIYKGKRCASGADSRERLTVFVCTNMSSTEKFPLLVVGRYAKPNSASALSKLPIQYMFNGKAWLTAEQFSNWLSDIDSWYVKHKRNILLIMPASPAHPFSCNLNAVKLVTAHYNYKGPVKHGIRKAIKQNYRRFILEHLIDELESRTSQQFQINKNRRIALLQALQFLASAWQNVSSLTVTNSFVKSGLVKYNVWDVTSVVGLATDNLELLYTLKSYGYNIPSTMTFDYYVSFDDDLQSSNLMADEDIVASVQQKECASDSESELFDGDTNSTTEQPSSNVLSSGNKSHARASVSPEKLQQCLNVIAGHVEGPALVNKVEVASVYSKFQQLINKSFMTRFSSVSK